MSQVEAKLKSLKPLSILNADGVKLNFSDGWLLVRPSGTEPKIRITAEAKTEKRARELYDNCLTLLNEKVNVGVKPN